MWRCQISSISLVGAIDNVGFFAANFKNFSYRSIERVNFSEDHSFGKVSDSALSLLKERFTKIKINDSGAKIPKEEVVNFYSNANYAIAGLENLDRENLECLPNLKIISRVGIGLDNIDLEYANEKGIKVLNTPDPPTDAVAEMVITAALSLSRNIFSYNDDLHLGRWNKSIGNSLKKKNVFLIGFGRIGQKVAKHFQYFGSNVYYFDPLIENSNFNKISFSEGLKNADIISIHSSSQNQIIGPKEFEKIKNGAIILNSSRGFHIDEVELAKSLKLGKIKSCWIDVFEDEPYSGDLINYDNAILSPHISTYTEACRLDMELEAVNNLLREISRWRKKIKKR